MMILWHSWALSLFFQCCIALSFLYSYKNWKRARWKIIRFDHAGWALKSSDGDEITVVLKQFYQFGLFWIVEFQQLEPKLFLKSRVSLPLLQDNCSKGDFRKLRQILLSTKAVDTHKSERF